MSKEKKVNSLNEGELGKVSGGQEIHCGGAISKPSPEQKISTKNYPGPVGHEGEIGYPID